MTDTLGVRYPPPARALREPDLLAGALERTQFEATVERVLDGDTLLVRHGTRRLRVWLLGSDAPELNYKGHTQRPWAEAALGRLQGLVPAGTRVRLVTDRQVFENYGRLLAHVFCGRRNINLEMLRSGWAVSYSIYPNVAQLGAAAQATTEAQLARRGIFDTRRPLPLMPYEFRQQVDGRPPIKFCGDIQTLRYFPPNEFPRVPIARRVFFFTEADARAFGYTPVGLGSPGFEDGWTAPPAQALTPAALARARLQAWREPARPLLS
jgi:endonuclease YncB( thermonuclease family)